MVLSINTTRKFGGKIYHLRVQLTDKLHRGHIDPYTIRDKYSVDVITRNLRKMGKLVRVVNVKPSGYRVYFRDA